ncbi:hypothetical protein C8K30_101738 [Promicromonospora sp. AC04]|uniref:hypothetical protein n=1 Tax=Promicromonospora sp. AC04 TaxID=2135723 RepID=UPI000D35AFF3|nr:hypothetical protein [Promicromonospora sp. AC04]PUB32216.1 hypothetical protein C8K30_101738 [Promicromonospora sp. AC04]
MLAIAPITDPDDGAGREDDLDRPQWGEPVDFPRASSGDPTFESRTDEILRSMNVDVCTEVP